MIHLIRTDAGHPDYNYLVSMLDARLQVINGDDHSFFAQYNASDTIHHVILAYWDNKIAGCGALRPYDNKTMEVKRMYVPDELRKRGIASQVLKALEHWAADPVSWKPAGK